MDEVQVVVAHSERATLRVGDVFLKVDADQARIDAEVEAMALAPVPTPEVLWRKPPVLAIAAVPGTTLGRLGGPSTGSPAAWAAAGAAVRKLHDAPLPPRVGRAGRGVGELAAELDAECEVLVANGLLPAELVIRNRQVAEAAFRPWTPAFTHGDLQNRASNCSASVWMSLATGSRATSAFARWTPRHASPLSVYPSSTAICW